MGNDLVAYRARIGSYHCIKKQHKNGEIQINFAVSIWITLQVIRILLFIAGVEVNPGPINQYNANIDRIKDQINHIEELFLSTIQENERNENLQLNTDTPHLTPRPTLRLYTPTFHFKLPKLFTTIQLFTPTYTSFDALYY